MRLTRAADGKVLWQVQDPIMAAFNGATVAVTEYSMDWQLGPKVDIEVCVKSKDRTPLDCCYELPSCHLTY